VPDIPISGGQVTSDRDSQTRRTASVDIAAPDLWPVEPLSLLTPLGAEMLIEYGIVSSPGTVEWVPLILGPITSVSRSLPYSRGGLSVQVADRSEMVTQAELETAQQSVVGASAVAEITRLITDVLPNAGVIDTTGDGSVAAQITIERDRWGQGVEPLATSIGAEVFCNQVGVFVIRKEPTVNDPAVWTLAEDGMSVLVEQSDDFTREDVYNRVVASGQRTDGTPPVYGVASDTNPTSPTYINGPFGIRPFFYASPLLTTQSACDAAAKTILARISGKNLQVDVSCIANPALDAGDVIRLAWEGEDKPYLIDSVVTPLKPSDMQTLRLRSLVLPEETSG